MGKLVRVFLINLLLRYGENHRIIILPADCAVRKHQIQYNVYITELLPDRLLVQRKERPCIVLGAQMKPFMDRNIDIFVVKNLLPDGKLCLMDDPLINEMRAFEKYRHMGTILFHRNPGNFRILEQIFLLCRK